MKWFDRVLAWGRRSVSVSLAVGSAIGGTSCEHPSYARPRPPLGYIPSGGSAVPSAPARAPIEGRNHGPARRRPEDWNWSTQPSDGRKRFPNAVPQDVDGSLRWRSGMDELAFLLAPQDDLWLAYYVPTLFTSLANPIEVELRGNVTPILTDEMQKAYARATDLKRRLRGGSWPKDQAMLVDLPGPEATAFAAVFAERLTPVFEFGNVAHPSAVVPSHQTLAAVLYYLPMFERGQRDRPSGARPIFVLDSNRELPYAEDEGVFDNRYFTKVPDAHTLLGIGIEKIVYVTQDELKTVDVRDLEDLGEVDSDFALGPPEAEEEPRLFAYDQPSRSISLGSLWWTGGGSASHGQGGSLGRFHEGITS